MASAHSDGRTLAMHIQLRDTQGGTAANGPRKKYTPVVRSTGCGWFGDHGVAMEILRVYWNPKFLPSPEITSNVSVNYNAMGVVWGQQAAAVTANSATLDSVEHSFRLAKLHKFYDSGSKEVDDDAEAFCVFRERWLVAQNRIGTASTYTQSTAQMTAMPGIAVWDYTDGAGHGILSSAPQLQMGGETMIVNTAAWEQVKFGGLTIEMNCTIIYRLVTVDLETFQRCI